MKRYAGLLFLLFSPLLHGQSVAVGSGIPPNVTASAFYQGARGVHPIYYWVCTRYTSGYVCPTSPVSAVNTQGIASLGGGNAVTISWSGAIGGATGYDVIRMATSGSFNGSCNNGCAIALNVQVSQYVDNNPAAGANYPPGGLAPARAVAGTISLNNTNYPTPGLLWNLLGVAYPFGLLPPGYVAGDCVIFAAVPPFLADGGLSCGGSGGAVTGSGTVGDIPLWTTSTTNLGNSHLTDNGTVVASAENLVVTPLAGSGTKCVHVTNTGQLGLAASDCGSGSGSVTGSGTAGNLPLWNGATSLGNADLTDNGTFTATNAEPFSFRVLPGMQQFANDTSTGTVVNTLTKIIANGTASAAIQATTSDTKNIIGICTVACGTSGNAQVSFLGQALCVMDGSNLVRDYVQVSTTTAGDCTDAGNAEPSNGKQTLGRIVTPSGGAGLAAVIDLYSPDTASHSGGSISFNPSPPTANAIVTAVSATQIQTPNSGLLADSSGDVTTPGNYTGAQLTTTGQATIEGNLNAQQTSNFGQPGQAASIGLYTADNNEVVWQTGSTGVNATETWTANPTGNGQVPTSSSCSGNSCNITWAAPAAGGITQLTGPITAGPGSGSQATTISASVALPGSPTTTTQSQGDNSTKIATTAYTDTAVSNAVAGINPAVAVLAASTANLTGTYSNGAGGIGATFTITATGAFTLDGVSISTIGQRVLLKNQTTAFQNGIYTATVVGVSLVSPVFTRALDYDQPSDINSTGAIPVQSGTVNTTTSWLLTSTVNTVGTDALTYTQFSINPATATTTVNGTSCPLNGSCSIGTTGVKGSNGYGMWQLTVPLFASFSWLNQGGATSTQGTNFLAITSPASASTNIRILHAACPTAPWDLYAYAMVGTTSGTTGANSYGGLEFDDGTKILTFAFNLDGGSSNIQTTEYTNVTTVNTTINNDPIANGIYGPWWLHVNNTAGALTLSYSFDGLTFRQLTTGTGGGLSAITNCGFFSNSQNSAADSSTMLSYAFVSSLTAQ